MAQLHQYYSNILVEKDRLIGELRERLHELEDQGAKLEQRMRRDL